MSESTKPPHSPIVEPPEPDASPEEQALAGELAERLESPGRANAGSPEAQDLAQAAQLVKASRHFELADASKARLRRELEDALEKREQKSVTDSGAPRGRFVRWFQWSAAAVALTAVVVTVLIRSSTPAPTFAQHSPVAGPSLGGPPAEPALVRPPASLVQAQAEALARAAEPDADARSSSKGDASRKHLDRELQAYRMQLIASLDRASVDRRPR